MLTSTFALGRLIQAEAAGDQIARVTDQERLLRTAELHVGTGMAIVKGHCLLAGVVPSLVEPSALAATPIQEALGTEALELR